MLLKTQLVLIGAGGHCRVIIDTAKRLGLNILGIIDIDYDGNKEKILDILKRTKEIRKGIINVEKFFR